MDGSAARVAERDAGVRAREEERALARFAGGEAALTYGEESRDDRIHCLPRERARERRRLRRCEALDGVNQRVDGARAEHTIWQTLEEFRHEHGLIGVESGIGKAHLRTKLRELEDGDIRDLAARAARRRHEDERMRFLRQSSFFSYRYGLTGHRSWLCRRPSVR